MAKTKMPNTSEATILLILVPGEKYGRQIREEYKKLTGDELKLGTLYTTLERMAGKGFLSARMGSPEPRRRGRRPRYYRILAAGRRALDAYQLRGASVFGLIRKATARLLNRAAFPLLIGGRHG